MATAVIPRLGKGGTLSKKKPVVEPDEALLARPPWLPPEKERRWPLPARGKQKKKQQSDSGPGRRNRSSKVEDNSSPNDSDAVAEDLADESYLELVDPDIDENEPFDEQFGDDFDEPFVEGMEPQALAEPIPASTAGAEAEDPARPPGDPWLAHFDEPEDTTYDVADATAPDLIGDVSEIGVAEPSLDLYDDPPPKSDTSPVGTIDSEGGPDVSIDDSEEVIGVSPSRARHRAPESQTAWSPTPPPELAAWLESDTAWLESTSVQSDTFREPEGSQVTDESNRDDSSPEPAVPAESVVPDPVAFEDPVAPVDEPSEADDLTTVAVVDDDVWQPIASDADQQESDPFEPSDTFEADPPVETSKAEPAAETFEPEPLVETFEPEPPVETFGAEPPVETGEAEPQVETEDAGAAPAEPSEPEAIETEPFTPEPIEPEAAEAEAPELDEIERRAAALLAALGERPESPADDDQPFDDEGGSQPEMADLAEPAEPEPTIAAEPEPVWQPPTPLAQPDADVPVVVPEPAAIWQPPTPLPQSEPEDAFDRAPEPQPTGEAPAEVAPISAGEPDEIEQRAAALLARMEARRAELDASEPDADPTDLPEPAIEEPADAAAADEQTVVVDHLEPNYLEHAGTTETTHDLTDVAVEDEFPVAPAEPSPESTGYGIAESESPWEGQRPDESLPEAPPLGEDAPTAGDATEGFGDATAPPPHRAAARKLALPPWQLPGAAASVEYERFGPDESVSDDRSLFSGRFERAAAEDVAQPPLTPESVSGDQDQNLTDVPPRPPAPQMRPGPPLPAGWPPRLPSGRPLPPPPPGWRPPLPPPAWAAGQAPAPQATPQQAAPPQPAAPQPTTQQAPPQHAAPPPNFRQPQAFRVPPPLDDAELADPRLNAPQIGWRRTVHKATGGHVNLGPSRRERLRNEIQEQIRQPIVGDFRIAVLSIKGGVGKTTTTLGLGSALAMVRHDRVIAVDANPDRGTLAERVRDVSTRSTVRDLLSDPNIHSYADVRNHTLMASSRLEVLASEQEPAVSEVFGDADYRQTIDILRHYYNIILTDCGTGIMHSAMSGILDLAHTIVLVSAPAMDAARSASATLDWLMQHGHSGLVRDAHVVFSASRPGSANLKIDKLYEHFETRCRSVHMIPFDPHLSEGADVDFGLLNQATMDAYLDLAASVSEDFGRLRGTARS